MDNAGYLPNYSAVNEQLHAVPLYSPIPDDAEHSLDFVMPSSSSSPTCAAGKHSFESEHMRVELRPQMWDGDVLAYGLNGVVEGTIRFSGEARQVQEIVLSASQPYPALTWPNFFSA